LAVPASSERFIEKARGLPADEVFLDLEALVFGPADFMASAPRRSSRPTTTPPRSTSAARSCSATR
jgi:citrate lyase beta subunit